MSDWIATSEADSSTPPATSRVTLPPVPKLGSRSPSPARAAGASSAIASAFASLLIHEGRLSVVEIAAQLGHNPTVCLDTYADVMAEERDGERVSAEDQIVQARASLATPSDADDQLSFEGTTGG